jgi:hypothetical protein
MDAKILRGIIAKTWKKALAARTQQPKQTP